MVKLEKQSSEEDIPVAPNHILENIVHKQEKVTPVKTKESPAKSKNIVPRNISQELGAPNVRSNGHVSDSTRRNKMLLDNFIQNNESLQINKKTISYEINGDDEVYLLQCPHKIDIDSLFGLEFIDKDKKKFKLGKNSYECVASNNDSNSRVNILIPPSKDESGHRLLAFNLQGSYIIKERVKDNHEIDVIAEDESVVPFPSNLKERHPLFGATFKSAIKLPASVKEKFSSPAPKLPKMKKIKVETNDDDVEMENNSSPVINMKKKKIKTEPIEENISPVKKSKKRKAESLDQEEECYEPKKKIKKENDIWTKETSIEENLFDLPLKAKRKSKQSS